MSKMTGPEQLRMRIMLLAMPAAARVAVEEMNLDDARQVASLRALVSAGALDSVHTLKLIANLRARGARPSREPLEALAKAVRDHRKGAEPTRLPFIHPRPAS